jgi:quercetin dioxygenase-like cupin family protein
MRRHIIFSIALASLSACATNKPAVVHNIGAMSPERLSPGLQRRFINSDNSSMAVYDMRRGAKVAVHTHTSEQVSYVQQGRLRFVVGGQLHDLRAGQAIVIPANTPHSIEALENSVEIDFFAPQRSDWVKDVDEQASAPRDQDEPRGSLRP